MTSQTALADPTVQSSLRLGGSRCVAWAGQRLPAGCTPSSARIGVDLRPDSTARLLVDHGVRYDGPHPELRRWIAEGTLEFDSIAELLTWANHWLLDGAASDPHRRAQRRTRAEQLTDLDAVRAPNRRTEISALLDPDEVAGMLAGEVVGQSRAIQTVSRQVCEHLAQCEPRRPLSIFAVGPSGVGKTAAAERLAEVVGELSGRPWGFIRLDMNEYREHHRISQFLGAPAGYVGHREATPLADLFNRHQAAVILFDEIDKAHPDVMIALMAALDAGRLTMGDGHTIDLRRSVLIFTSNGHADPILERVTGDMTAIEVDSVCRQELLTGGTWPALVGRIRSHVLFGPLDERASAEVAVLAIERAGTAFGLRVAVIDPGVVTALLGHSADLGLGVRRFEHDATALLGAAFVDHLRLGSTDDNVAVRWVDGSVIVEPTAPVPTNEEVDSERI